MAYFKNIHSLAELKKEYRRLALERLYNREESKIDFSKFRKKKKTDADAQDGDGDE